MTRCPERDFARTLVARSATASADASHLPRRTKCIGLPRTQCRSSQGSVSTPGRLGENPGKLGRETGDRRSSASGAACGLRQVIYHRHARQGATTGLDTTPGGVVPGIPGKHGRETVRSYQLRGGLAWGRGNCEGRYSHLRSCRRRGASGGPGLAAPSMVLEASGTSGRSTRQSSASTGSTKADPIPARPPQHRLPGAPRTPLRGAHIGPTSRSWRLARARGPGARMERRTRLVGGRLGCGRLSPQVMVQRPRTRRVGIECLFRPRRTQLGRVQTAVPLVE